MDDDNFINIEDIPTADPNVPSSIIVNRYTIYDDHTLDRRKIIAKYANHNEVPHSVLNLLSLTENRNILKLIIHPNDSLMVYSPYVELSFYDLIGEKNFLYPQNSASRAFFIVQLIKGVSWLHENLIFHGLLNPQMVFLENYYTVKVGGFYFSEKFADKNDVSAKARYLHYTPPQGEENRLGLKYDIWCVGNIIFEFLLRKYGLPLANVIANNDLQSNWSEYLSDPDDVIYIKYANFLDPNHQNRPFLNENVAQRDLNSICEFMNGEFKKFENYWSIENITDTTKKIIHKEKHEIRCLKIRYFNKQVHDFQRELTILKDSNNMNEKFAALYLADMAILDQPFIWLMTEYTENKSLKDKIKTIKKQNRKFTEYEMNYLVSKLIDILVYMHRANVIHRNLKPTNVLIFEGDQQQITLKFTDFYSAKSNVGQVATNLTAIPKSPYTAPELFDADCEYGKPVDVWSIGCIIHEMATLERTFNGLTRPKVTLSILDSPRIQKLCERMVKIDPSKRATAEELLEDQN